MTVSLFPIQQQTFKGAVKSTVLDLAMQGMERLVVSYVSRNPWCRACDVSRGAFKGYDHKQMLASVVLRNLVSKGKLVKIDRYKRDNQGDLILPLKQLPGFLYLVAS
tara:strand:+ start:1683 stop:2003 length:321 start_codon:yes stop_codon:yes gene_type:complete